MVKKEKYKYKILKWYCKKLDTINKKFYLNPFDFILVMLFIGTVLITLLIYKLTKE